MTSLLTSLSRLQGLLKQNSSAGSGLKHLGLARESAREVSCAPMALLKHTTPSLGAQSTIHKAAGGKEATGLQARRDLPAPLPYP